MRKREEIEKDGKLKNDLIIEVLLDIRGLLKKPQVKKKGGKNGKRNMGQTLNRRGG